MTSHCGYVAIVGRPNVGKSTLLNRLIGEKISITSDKPQTTRHCILGVNTIGDDQIVYIDTPGLHKKSEHALNRYMNRVAGQIVSDVDIVVWVVEALKWTDEDDWILRRLKKMEVPIILVVNKVDKAKQKDQLLPFLDSIQHKLDFKEIILISARTGKYVADLQNAIRKLLPENEHFFPSDQITDKSERFLAAEIIREKLMRGLGQELPYKLTVLIEEFKEEPKITRISAVIYIEKDSQKAILIGEKGEKLKKIGQQARLDMERLFERKVFLRLWVKVKSGWTDDERALRFLGYE